MNQAQVREDFDRMVMETRINVPMAEQGVTIVQGFRAGCLEDFRARVTRVANTDGEVLDDQVALNHLVAAVRYWNGIWNYAVDNSGRDYMAKDGFLGFMKKMMADDKDHDGIFFKATKFL